MTPGQKESTVLLSSVPLCCFQSCSLSLELLALCLPGFVTCLPSRHCHLGQVHISVWDSGGVQPWALFSFQRVPYLSLQDRRGFAGQEAWAGSHSQTGCLLRLDDGLDWALFSFAACPHQSATCSAPTPRPWHVACVENRWGGVHGLFLPVALSQPFALQMDLGTVGVETHPQPAQSLVLMSRNTIMFCKSRNLSLQPTQPP